ncbi:Protein CATP-1 a, partial [Aphelenchoides avenae]
TRGVAKWLRSIFSHKVHPSETRSAEQEQQDLSASYVEHHLTIDQLQDIYSDSYIDAENPDQSDGLSTEEAKKRLADGGYNVIPDPPKESNWRLFMKQFFYQFWILLIGAAILSLIIYFIRLVHGSGSDATLHLTTAILLIGIVIVMSIHSFWQERKTIRIVSNFEAMHPKNCFVIRDNEEKQIHTDELVVGDLITISSGQRIPADVRIIVSNGLKIEMSAITGLATAHDYTHEAAASHVGVLEARNIAFKGSYCTEGDGVGIVIRTGEFTILGNFADLHTRVKANESLLQKEISKFVNFVCIVAITMAAVFYVIGLFVANFKNVLYHFVASFLIIIVANVPQGLPPTVMSQLSIIARRMAKKNVYIKKLDVIDELGAATVIATDKTGTLTENKMRLISLWYNNQPHSTQATLNKLKIPTWKPKLNKDLDQPLRDILIVMAVCNKAHFDKCRRSVRRTRVESSKEREKSVSTQAPRTKKFTVIYETGHETIRGAVTPVKVPSCKDLWEAAQPPQEQRPVKSEQLVKSDSVTTEEDVETEKTNCVKRSGQVIGTPLDIALLTYVECVASAESIRGRFQMLFEVPFNSVRRWQLVVARCLVPPQCADAKELTSGDDEVAHVVLMKGAPEVILSRCSRVVIDNELVDINDEFRDYCQKLWEDYGSNGSRVIAFAHRHFYAKKGTKFNATSENYPQEELIFLGMAALLDPPRPETPAAIKQCKQAGIKVYMITGDHPTAAMAIASRIGLIDMQKDQARNVRKNGDSKVSLQMWATDKDWAIVLGETLPNMDKQQWDKLLAHPYIVFAR